MIKTQIPDIKIIEQLRQGGAAEDQALTDIYQNNRMTILNFIKKNGGTMEEAKDVFQESVIQFYENVKQGKFRGESAISSYLYSIARFTWLNRLKRKQTERRIIDTQEFNEEQAPFLNTFLGKEKQMQVLGIFEKLGTNCKDILIHTIYYNYSMQEIVKQLNLSNEQVARNQKYKCLKKLKAMIKEKPQLLNFLKP